MSPLVPRSKHVQSRLYQPNQLVVYDYKINIRSDKHITNQMHSVGRKYFFFILNLVVYILTTGLLKG
jgi:hypothetical protein